MKNSMFILRLGVPFVCNIDKTAIAEITDRELDMIHGVPTPVGLLSLVSTELNANEIVNVFKKAEKESKDNGPVIVWDANSDGAGFNIPMDIIQNMIKDFEKQYDVKILKSKKEMKTLSLDELLNLAIKNENYEEASLLKKKIDKASKSKSPKSK